MIAITKDHYDFKPLRWVCLAAAKSEKYVSNSRRAITRLHVFEDKVMGTSVITATDGHRFHRFNKVKINELEGSTLFRIAKLTKSEIILEAEKDKELIYPVVEHFFSFPESDDSLNVWLSTKDSKLSSNYARSIRLLKGDNLGISIKYFTELCSLGENTPATFLRGPVSSVPTLLMKSEDCQGILCGIVLSMEDS